MIQAKGALGAVVRRTLSIALFFGVLVPPLDAEAFDYLIRVRDENNSPVSGFRWLIQKDNTNLTVPGARVADSIALDIHNSYAPVVVKGHEATDSVLVTIPDGVRYFVSVLPDAGFTLGGAQMPAFGQFDYNGNTVTVKVNSFPVPTAQISVFVFKDHERINGVVDAHETGLAGASIQLHDAAGQVTQDAFGNPLGTEYDALGNVTAVGDGSIVTKATDPEPGRVVIKYLTPGKYGIIVTPPPPTGTWIQTSTIEGTPTIDAWVKANESETFIEGFGTGFTHVFFGFVNPAELPWALTPPAGTGSIRGRLLFNHFSRPPTTQGFFPGPKVDQCWVALGDPATPLGLYAASCDNNSRFQINNVPPGTYQLTMWDENLDALIGFQTVTVPDAVGNMNVDLQDVLMFRWFGTLKGSIFLDADRDGFPDAGEAGAPAVGVIIRFRDGTIYQATVSDPGGEYEFGEVFPFFKWLVTEVGFTSDKATGMTAAVDYGGQIPDSNGWHMPSFDVLNPQPQAAVNANIVPPNRWSRTEAGEVLTQAMQLYLNQTNVIAWGKDHYADAENGGITGIVYHAVTRAENDPRKAAAEPWEPGIPRVQMALYPDADFNDVIDDLDGDGFPTRADVDNYPFGDFPGVGDLDRNSNGVFDPGDAIQITTTDSWDDNKPSGCIQDLPGDPPGFIHGQPVAECYDSFGTWNQVRPGVFDGGFAFGSYFPGGIVSGSAEVEGIPSGIYIVEAATPANYVLLKEENRNVDFGEEYGVPQGIDDNPLPQCVGDLHLVPAELTLFPGVPAPDAGRNTPLCDLKQVLLTGSKNAGVEFFFFTEVPPAARAVGFANNDLAAEFDKTSPVFGEKAAPAWLPISIQDYAGNEVARVYMDEYGAYNAVLPSTFTVNVASPTGVSPNMLTLVLNHPFKTDPITGLQTPDEWYDPTYSTTPWTFNFEPGRTSYLDTPLVPIGSFAGFGIDSEPADGTPVIYEVRGTHPGGGGSMACSQGDLVRIFSPGTILVPNPDFDPAVEGTVRRIWRDFGFGLTEG